jgi:putative membrane-bound dehydrogenase-like protein
MMMTQMKTWLSKQLLASTVSLCLLVAALPVLGQHELDQYGSPYHVGLDFPKLTTPQWVGEAGVDAVVVLAIDDMRDSAKYESYLRPILERLKAIDGRAPVSIMTNRVAPADDVLIQGWLKEGLSIEVHTYDHPCPCLKGNDFPQAKGTYDRCVDLLAKIPGAHPVAFRMPCCDSLNTPSPRFWEEIFNATTADGNFLTIDTSVFQIFTSDDPDLPADLVTRPDGTSRFRHYLPFPSFVNTIENYPYPYVIGRKCWQFPCVVPSDWEAQHVQKPNNPETLRDWKLALDATVIKQGTFNLVFHPHGWMRNDQVVELLDYAQATYGKRVKFLNFREVDQRLNKHLLAGHSLRDARGRDAGTRLMDIDADGYMDVVHSDVTRLWQHDSGRWKETPTGFQTVIEVGETLVDSARFGRTAAGEVLAIWQNGTEDALHQSVFRQGAWHDLSKSSGAADVPGRVHFEGKDAGLRLRDLDGDGVSELLATNSLTAGGKRSVSVWLQGERGWVAAGFDLPPGVGFVDSEGRDAGLRLIDLDRDGLLDAVFSDLNGYRVDLLRRDSKIPTTGSPAQLTGWIVAAVNGTRPADQGVPVISRGGTNNGAWFHSEHLWIQNEQTDQLPNGVDRRTYAQLLGDVADMPPPRSPERSLQSLQLSIPGHVELVAAEPLTADPVAFDWGPDGRLWIVEMADYPLGLDGKGEPGGRVRVLSDTDHDGKYDKSTLFLDKIPFPNGIKVWRNGVIVSTAPDVFYAEDQDGDEKSDHREVLFTGFVEGNQQHRVNGLRWGLDNWLYLANGDSGGEITSTKTGQRLNISGRDLRIRPDDGAMDTIAGQTQFGRNRDDWGNWFGGNNSNPGWHYVLDAQMIRRNADASARSMKNNVTSPPGASPVFPISRTLTRFNDFSRADRFTSACSHDIYRDHAFPGMYGDFLVCEPVHNLVHRHRLSPVGVTFEGHRAPEESDRELLASSDNWFRPVMVRTGPDGALWVADMYRLVIEHPEWIPATWQERLNLRDGQQAGRIYRIVPPQDGPGQATRTLQIPNLAKLTTRELAARLDDSNGWIRDMSHQLILWRSDADATEIVREFLQCAATPLGRVHALGILQGLEQIGDADVAVLLADKEPRARAFGLRMGRGLTAPSYWARLFELASSEADPRVQLELAYSLGEVGTDKVRAARQLGVLAGRVGGDPWRIAAVISSLQADTLLEFSRSLQRESSVPNPAFRAAILQIAVARRQWDVVPDWIGSAASNDSERRSLLEGLAAVQKASRGQIPAADQAWLQKSLGEARRIAVDEGRSIELRSQALGVLGYLDGNREADTELAMALANPSESPTLQIAAIQLVFRTSGADGASNLLSQWRSLTPLVRDAFVTRVLSDPKATSRLVDRIADGTVRRSELGARAQQLLTDSTDASIRQRLEDIWDVKSSRGDVVEAQLTFTATQKITNATNGKALFAKHCSVCHQLQGVGKDVAPNLAALTDRSLRGLVTAILDPNRAVEDKYLDYLVTTVEGQTHRGMLGLETDTHVVLVGADAKTIEVSRRDVDELVSSGKSLMPEGFERQMNPSEIGDLVAYLQATRAAPKAFAGNQLKLAPMRDDGSARLFATDCAIYGPTLVFESQYRNLGFWGSEQDTAVWSVDLPRAGKYRVSLDYACDNATAGNRYRVEVAGAVLTGDIEGTGGWESYRSKGIGTLELPAGPIELTIRSDGVLRGYLMDLRGMVLRPE